MNTWKDFKKELKKQFYLENATYKAHAKLRILSKKRSIRDYVKEFTKIILEIPDYLYKEALFAFMDGLQHWVRMEIERKGG